MVPNAALRWTPTPQQVVPDVRKEATQTARRKGPSSDSSGSGAGKDRGPTSAPVTRGRVWVQDGQFVRPIPVIVGLSDGSMTEIQGEGLEGREVIVSETIQSAGNDTTNPFTPQLFGNRRPG